MPEDQNILDLIERGATVKPFKIHLMAVFYGNISREIARFQDKKACILELRTHRKRGFGRIGHLS